jgi:hypothetical protein
LKTPVRSLEFDSDYAVRILGGGDLPRRIICMSLKMDKRGRLPRLFLSRTAFSARPTRVTSCSRPPRNLLVFPPVTSSSLRIERMCANLSVCYFLLSVAKSKQRRMGSKASARLLPVVRTSPSSILACLSWTGWKQPNKSGRRWDGKSSLSLVPLMTSAMAANGLGRANLTPGWLNQSRFKTCCIGLMQRPSP